MNTNPLIKVGLDMVERRRERNASERTWLKQVMFGDQDFAKCTRTRRHNAREGRTYVAWEYQDEQPRIRALVRINNITVRPGCGLRVHLDVSTPEDVYQTEFSWKPRKMPGLDLFFWVPAHSEVRFTPLDSEAPLGTRCMYVQFLASSTGHPDQDKIDGALHFEMTTDFCKRWPQHAF